MSRELFELILSRFFDQSAGDRCPGMNIVEKRFKKLKWTRLLIRTEKNKKCYLILLGAIEKYYQITSSGLWSKPNQLMKLDS